MKIDVQLTDQEIAFLKALATKAGRGPNRIFKDKHDAEFRQQWWKEIKEFKEHGILIGGNHHIGGEFQGFCHKLNALGEKLQKEHVEALVA